MLQSRRAYITAKQRREMKKKKQTDGSFEDTEENEIFAADGGILPPQKEKKDFAAPLPLQPKPKVQPQPAAPRGKKGKLKRIKEKYADQDEEERQLRMEILQVFFCLMMRTVTVDHTLCAVCMGIYINPVVIPPLTTLV